MPIVASPNTVAGWLALLHILKVTDSNTVKPLSILSEETVENKGWMRENDSCRKEF
jgi:hypothetical protein